MSKVPLKGSRGFYDATTDLRDLKRMAVETPHANIGLRTGQASGILVVDEDRDGAFAELEDKIGPQQETWTVETPRGLPHRYYLLPEGESVPSSAGDGLDIRADGGYVVLPPSRTPQGEYKVVGRLAMAPASPELIKWARERKATGKVSRRRESTGPRETREAGGTVPVGERNGDMVSFLGKAHDGARTVGELVDLGITRRDEDYEEPQTFPDAEVEKVALWVHAQEPCKGARPRELTELVEALGQRWYELERKGLGGKNEVRFLRLVTREGMKVGTITAEGDLGVRMSFLQAAGELGCHVNTITNLRDRLAEKGELRWDGSKRQSKRDPGTFVLPDPRRTCDSLDNSHTKKEGTCSTITSTSRKGAESLETAHYRHRGLVGYSMEDTLCHFEAHGPMTADGITRLLGWARARDLKLRHLDPLVELGLLELRGGLYALPGDYRESQEDVQAEEYSTVQARVARVRSEEGLWVHVVRESGIVASEHERARLAAQEAERKRLIFHDWLDHGPPRVDRAPTEEEMARGREARQKRRRIEGLVREGMRRDFATEEVLGADGYVEDLRPVEDPDPPPAEPDEHDLGCECPDCSATVPSYVRLA